MSTPFWDSAGSLVGPGTDGPLYPQDDPWATCFLQGEQLPGIVTVLVPSKQRRVQNKKQNGSDGNTPTFRGMDPAKGTIKVTIWTPAQLARMDDLLPLIYPNPNKDVNKLSALDISSPITHHRGIKSIIIEDIDGPNDTGTKGFKEYVLKWFEYIPTKAKTATKTVDGAVAVTPAFQRTPGATKNSPQPPSATDFGPSPAPTPQQGGT